MVEYFEFFIRSAEPIYLRFDLAYRLEHTYPHGTEVMQTIYCFKPAQ